MRTFYNLFVFVFCISLPLNYCFAQDSQLSMSESNYDDLANWKKELSNLAFELIPSPLIETEADGVTIDHESSKRIEAVHRKRLAIYQQYENAISNPKLIELLELMDSDMQFGDAFEFSAEQRENIEAIRQEYGEKIAQLKGQLDSNETNTELTNLEQQFRCKMVMTLLPHQVKELEFLNPVGGSLPKALTESPYGHSLQLTDQQKERIRKKSDELAAKIHEFHLQTRQEAVDLVFKELTPEQRQRVLDQLGPEVAVDRFGRTPLNKLFVEYLYSDVKDICDCNSVLGAVNNTPVKLPEQK